MQQIPIESLNLPSNVSFPLALTKNGKGVARVIAEDELKEDRKMSLLRLQISPERNQEEAKKNGMTQEILDELLKDIS